MAYRPGLRARGAFAMALLALVVASGMAVLTYQFARRYLVDQRENFAVRQTAVNAGVVKASLEVAGAQPGDVLPNLALAEPSRALLRVGGEWYSVAVELGPEQVPDGLRELVSSGSAGQQWVMIGSSTYLVTGIPLGSVDGAYFELTPPRELDRTLSVIRGSLAAAAVLTAGLGALGGWLISRRVLLPLRTVSAAAERLSEGALDARLDAGSDPDLEPLADSFNRMAAALEERIAREIRFTSDVSHELRTPLTAISSAADLARRTELPDRARMAIDVLAAQVDHFRELVLELLEISRYDAGDVALEPEELDPVALVHTVMARFDPEVPVEVAGPPAGRVVADRRRLERVIANLVENAERYAGGPTRIEVDGDATMLRLAIEDAGPGVPPDERQAVFGRFNRGSAEPVPGQPKGTGLGLALVEQHVLLHQGRIWVEDAPGGGARFVVELPRRPG